MDYNVDTVALDRIDADDETFCITTNPTTTDLALSISAIGLLHPPLLAGNDRGYLIVCGFRRIAACLALGLTHVSARIFREPPPYSVYAKLAVADNASQRPLNVVEQSRAAALIRRFTEKGTDWRAHAAHVGLPDSKAALERILPIAEMPEPLQAAIVEGSVALPIALRVHALKQPDAAALCSFLRYIKTGLNIQRELVEMIEEISIRDSISMAQLLAAKDLTAILDQEEMPLPERVDRLRRVLKWRRFPELSKAEDAYFQARKALKLNPRIQIQPPRFFEGNTFRLSLSIQSRAELLSLIPDIEKIAANRHLLPE